MLVSGAALLLACTAFITYDMVTFQANMFRNLSTQAQIIGSNTASAPAVQRSELCGEHSFSPESLSRNPVPPAFTLRMAGPSRHIPAIEAGQVQALPAIPSGTTENPLAQEPGDRAGPLDRVSRKAYRGCLHPIRCGGTKSTPGAVRRDRRDRSVGIHAGGFAGFVHLPEKPVAEPIVRLAEIAHIVSRDRNYSLRATPYRGGGGELSILIDAFNEMLAQTQQSEGALRQAHDQLEQRVKGAHCGAGDR